MQPGYSYTPDDFARPAFCAGCGAHVPKALLASTGGFCLACSARLSSPQAVAPQFRGYRTPFWRSNGCIALVLFFIAVGLFVGAMMHFLKIPLPGTKGALSGLPGSKDLPSNPSPNDSAMDAVRSRAAAEINTEFGGEVQRASGVEVETLHDQRTNTNTYLAKGNFEGSVHDDRVSVSWQISYSSDGNGGFRAVSREALYPTPDGQVAQYDWGAHKFIHLQNGAPTAPPDTTG